MPQPMPDKTVTPELVTWLTGSGLRLKSSYRVDEVAKVLDFSRSTVYAMIQRGELDAVFTDKGKRR